VETVLSVPLGSDPQALGVDMPEGAEHRIPGAYTVTKDAVLILDTLKCRVAEFRGTRMARAVAVRGLSEGRSLAVDGAGDWYVYDAVGDVVIALSPSGQVKSTCRVSDEIWQRGVPLLRPNGSGEVVLTVGTDEYRLSGGLSAPSAGLTFPGVRGRHTMEYPDQRTISVRIDGRERWRIACENELFGMTLLGYDRQGRLLAIACDPSLTRRLVVFALETGGRVIQAYLDMAGFEDYSEMPLLLGADGELYRLGFNREEAVLQRLQFQVSG
jgi:hypothetical protein